MRLQAHARMAATQQSQLLRQGVLQPMPLLLPQLLLLPPPPLPPLLLPPLLAITAAALWLCTGGSRLCRARLDGGVLPNPVHRQPASSSRSSIKSGIFTSRSKALRNCMRSIYHPGCAKSCCLVASTRTTTNTTLLTAPTSVQYPDQ
jgi:hypothetical protein